MIVDCHTHIWSDRRELGKGSAEYLRRQCGDADVPAGAEEHARAAKCADCTLVLGLRSRHLGADVPNELIARYVSKNSDRMIGIAAIDPTQEDELATAAALLAQDAFGGLTVSPAAQNFSPSDPEAMKLYEFAAHQGAPVFFQQGLHFRPQAVMEYARPSLLDDVARQLPNLTIVISSLGYPWIDETLALIGKHERVFADISGLLRRPQRGYGAIVAAQENGVIDKLLFASDFPFGESCQAAEALFRLNEMTHGTNLPSVPRESLRSIVQRDALAVLGLRSPEK